jgi:hypothetical protein
MPKAKKYSISQSRNEKYNANKQIRAYAYDHYVRIAKQYTLKLFLKKKLVVYVGIQEIKDIHYYWDDEYHPPFDELIFTDGQ